MAQEHTAWLHNVTMLLQMDKCTKILYIVLTVLITGRNVNSCKGNFDTSCKSRLSNKPSAWTKIAMSTLYILKYMKNSHGEARYPGKQAERPNASSDS